MFEECVLTVSCAHVRHRRFSRFGFFDHKASGMHTREGESVVTRWECVIRRFPIDQRRTAAHISQIRLDAVVLAVPLTIRAFEKAVLASGTTVKVD